jgi:hypothetical protein
MSNNRELSEFADYLTVDDTTKNVGIGTTLKISAGGIFVANTEVIRPDGTWGGPDTGLVGAQGAQGFQGAVGAQGAQGAVGAQGAQGAQGYQGAAGSGTGTADQIFEGNSYAEILDTGSNGIFRFLPEGNEVFRISTDGNTGIGTNNPTTKLVVQGDWVSSTGQLRIKPSSAGQTLSGFTFGKQDNTLLATNYSNSSTGNLYFQNNTESGNIIFTGPTLEHFRIGSSGQFGIGGATYGTSGQVLTSQGSGSAPQWATPGLGTPLTSSLNGVGSANKSVPSGTKRITIAFYGVSTASGSGRATVNLGTSGGIVYSGYKSANVYINAGNGIYTQTDGWVIWNPDAGISWSGTVTLTLTDGSSLWAANWTGVYDTTSVYTGGGTVNISNVTQVEVGCLGIGAFDDGTIGVYFE